MRRVLLLGLLAACSPWPDVSSSATDLEEPASVGVRVAEASVYRDTHIAGSFQASGLYLSILEGKGHDEDGDLITEPVLRILRIGEDDAVTALPKPPFVSETLFATVIGDEVIVAAEPGIAIFDGSWDVVPYPSGVDTTMVRAIAARDGGAFALITKAELWLYDGTWHTVPVTVDQSSLRIAAVEAAGVRVAYWTGSDVAAPAFTWSGAAIGTPVSASPFRIVSAAPNGTLDDFQLACVDRIVWVHGGVVTTGESGSSTPQSVMLPTPGSVRSFVFAQPFTGEGFPDADRVEGGVATMAAAAGSPHVECAGNGAEEIPPTCVAHDLVVYPTVDPTASTLALFAMSDLNAHRTIYLRRAPLPFLDSYP